MKKLLTVLACISLMYGCVIDLHSNKTLVKVNDKINNNTIGICTDYAQDKQGLLAEQDIKSFLATAWVRPVIKRQVYQSPFMDTSLSQELVYHMVTVVPIDDDHLILDSYHTMVYHPAECWYKWDKMQTDNGWRKVTGVIKTKNGSKLITGKEVTPPLYYSKYNDITSPFWNKTN